MCDVTLDIELINNKVSHKEAFKMFHLTYFLYYKVLAL